MNRKVPLSNQLEGSILAENLYDAESKLLLRAGVKLTESMIALLRKRNKHYVEIELVQEPSGVCEECGCVTGLELPNNSDRPALPWVCPGCGSIYFGSNPSLQSELAPVEVILQPAKQIALSPAIEQAFNESQVQSISDAERRKYNRIVASIPVTLVPLDPRFRISGEPVEVKAVDISRGGLCLLHTSPLQEEFLYLELGLSSNRQLQRIARITRVRSRDAVFEIGCQFVCRVANHNVLPNCSVTGCTHSAVCEVYRVNVYIPEGDLFFERDDTCLYLCSVHVVENEELAQGARQPRGIVHYPHSNQKLLQGFTIYKPLRVKQTSDG